MFNKENNLWFDVQVELNLQFYNKTRDQVNSRVFTQISDQIPFKIEKQVQAINDSINEFWININVR